MNKILKTLAQAAQTNPLNFMMNVVALLTIFGLLWGVVWINSIINY